MLNALMALCWLMCVRRLLCAHNHVWTGRKRTSFDTCVWLWTSSNWEGILVLMHPDHQIIIQLSLHHIQLPWCTVKFNTKSFKLYSIWLTPRLRILQNIKAISALFLQLKTRTMPPLHLWKWTHFVVVSAELLPDFDVHWQFKWNIYHCVVISSHELRLRFIYIISLNSLTAFKCARWFSYNDLICSIRTRCWITR